MDALVAHASRRTLGALLSMRNKTDLILRRSPLEYLGVNSMRVSIGVTPALSWTAGSVLAPTKQRGGYSALIETARRASSE